MAKTKEREEALLLRRKGFSIGDISKRLHVSKSTVSVWCRDLSLSEKAIEEIAKKSKKKSTAALLKYSELRRSARLHAIQEEIKIGKKMLGVLDDRDIFCIGLGIYWGEGYKRGSQEFGFTNSDPQMILFYIKWLKTIFNINLSDLILRVSINEQHASREVEVKQYWAELTKIPISQFTKTSLIKTVSKKIYKNSDMHMGTLRIKVRRGTAMRRRVLGALMSINSW